MHTSTKLILIIGFLSFASAAYNIQYSAFLDNRCGQVDSTLSGQIFEGQCVSENLRAHRTGKITFINAEYLTSCDYSDLSCSNLIICENYTNTNCYGSSVTSFSNKYSWTADGNGGWTIMYSAFNDVACSEGAKDTKLSSQIFYNQCSAEFGVIPQTGKITFINDDYLTSCDYSDSVCGEVTVCENYTNSICYSPDPYTTFSNVYAWNRVNLPTSAPETPAPVNPTASPAPATASPTSAPASSEEEYTGSYDITYTGYNDNRCSDVKDEVTGPIFAHKCAKEFSKAPKSGKITSINAQYLTSCDYSDRTCGVQTECQDYNINECYSSPTSDFSNKYNWVPLSVFGGPEGAWAINYTSYSDKSCGQVREHGAIFENQCAEEYKGESQSGMITFINDDYLTSCDYSDGDCKNVIVCENYNNTQCYGSMLVSFSNKYSWVRSVGSSASTIVLSMVSLVLCLAVALF